MKINELNDYVLSKCGFLPEIGCVLGSSWGFVGELISDKVFIPYEEIDGMPTCSVAGHKGGFSIGKLFGKTVVLAEGRIHLYEGKSILDTVKPIEIMHALGATKLLVTNAAGGIKKGMHPGDFMAISDHMNLTGQNPLIGKTELGNARFVDMCKAYDDAYVTLALKIGKSLNIPVHLGVYAQLLGPSFETPAEIRFLSKIGADAVGMSTAIEVIYARHLNMRVAAISCITNLAAGLSHNLSHDEVLDVSSKSKDNAYQFLSEFISKM